MYCYNGAQRYDQFLQVGRLYWALILLGLALSSESLCVEVFVVLYMYYNFCVYILLLPFSELSLVRLALDVVD